MYFRVQGTWPWQPEKTSPGNSVKQAVSAQYRLGADGGLQHGDTLCSSCFSDLTSASLDCWLETADIRGTEVTKSYPLPHSLLNWRDLHAVRHFPHLVSMRLGNSEEGPSTLYEGGNKDFLLWSQTGPGPSVSLSS